MIHSNFQGSRHCGSRQDDFSYFPYRYKPNKQAHFGPQKHNLDATFQGSMQCGFRQKYFFMFPLYKPRHRTCDLQGGTIFWPKKHNLNKLGRGPLDDGSYQSQASRPCGFKFRQVHFFKFSCRKSISSLCDLDMQWTGTI